MSFDPQEVERVAAAALGEPVPQPVVATLTGFLDELARWNAAHNLTAIREPAQMLVLHLADCAAALPALRDCLSGRPAPRVLDVGSGGGLPGAVIAAVMPGIDVTCIDAVAKKAAFVRHVAGTQRLANLHAVRGRVEQHRPALPYDVVASRAFARLADFVALTRHLLAANGAWMAMKGRVPDEEINELPADVEVFHVKPLQVPGLEAQRCLVWMRLRPSP